LATTGWLFWHDLRPRLLPGEPPMFNIDLVEEVHKSGNPLKTNWIVERQDRKQSEPHQVFRASTWVERKQEDVYTLRAELDASKDPNFQPVTVSSLFKIDLITSAYSVTRSGQLHALEATVKVHVKWGSSPLLQLFDRQPDLFQKGSSTDSISLRVWGEVHDQQLFAHCSASNASEESPVKKPIMQLDLPPAAVSYSGSVLMPLHPVDRIPGLRLGQGWRQPLVDPLSDAFSFLPGISSGVRWLHARVRPQPEVLKLNGGETRCLVIEYTNDENETVGRTWVEEDGERVLQQEAILEDIHWIMRRESTRRSGMGLLGS
jgi:hypothetical protein